MHTDFVSLSIQAAGGSLSLVLGENGSTTGGPFPGYQNQVNFGPTGEIESWALYLAAQTPFIQFADFSGHAPTNSGSHRAFIEFVRGHVFRFGDTSGEAGTWSRAAVSVPSPIVGAGLPGIVIAFAALFVWRRQRRRRAQPQ